MTPLTIARAIVIHEGKILLLRNQYEDGEFYGFPGGRQELGEELEACAVRETKEETGIDVRLVKPLYLHEFIDETKPRHLVTTYFLAEPVDTTQQPDHTRDPDEHETKIQEALWVELERMKELPMRPAEVAERILAEHNEGFGAFAKLPTTRR